MNRRTYTGIGIALALVAVYLIFFVNWSTPQAQGAFMLEAPRPPARVAPGRPAPKPPTVFPVTFCLNRGYTARSIKAIPLINIDLVPDPTPAWHLVATDKPVRVQIFRYGQNIPGMKPAVAKIRPETLVADRPYRLIIDTEEGQTVTIDFQTKPYANRR